MPRIREVTTGEVYAAMQQVEARGPTSLELGAMRGSADPQRAQYIIIDVREDTEWTAGHIPGAIHLGRGIIERDIENMVPDKTTKLVLYCGGGFRSALVAENLGKMGYTNAISLDGGWKALKESGLPLA